MKLAGVLVLVGAALLLTSGGDCGICPVIKQKAELFLHGSQEEYLSFVKQYKDSRLILENAGKIKKCVDNSLTEEDKTHAMNLIERIDASPVC
ncbi:major allergen I polypeptide chain 1-like [Grammomys surdaster]|uniref:major allergen I polypeptide chain 1-like n=1 Tax=Grammomys surdaster TaxID=491861 RepID=UPI0010A0A8F9|nr:major allergen I polypeptide chain 1-like [Grammomys surdaster]